MSLESVFKLSLIMNMVDNLTSPLSRARSSVGSSISSLQGMEQSFANATKAGAAMAGVGAQITDAALAPVTATFATKKALGELATLGVKDLGMIENAARSFSDQWAGTTKSDFITAAYDIRSGIASLSDEGVAGYTELAGITSKATKSNIAEMTSLFASGYGIYKDFYSDLTDLQFGEMFSAGIAKSVQQFKTTGSGMSQAIQTLGASATTSNVPLEEQLSILGMLQATMGGSEAGTKYKAFLRSAVKGGDELGLKFTDANNQLLSMPEILGVLQGKFGQTMDAAEKMKLQQAFGDAEAVALIDLMYSKTGDLQNNIVGMYDALGKGTSLTQEMASAINNTEPDQFQKLQQRIQNVKETIGNSLLPTINEYMAKGEEVLTKVGSWIEKHQDLVRVIMLVVIGLGAFLTVAGTTIAIVGGVGLVFTKTAGFVRGFVNAVKLIKYIPGLLDTIYIKALYAGDGIKKGFSAIKNFSMSAISGIKSVALNIANMARTAAISAVTALKNMAVGLVGMAKQAITTAATAMPGLIASVWGFTAALLANPITWVVIAIIALVAGIVLLWNKCEGFRNVVTSIWNAIKQGFGSALTTVKNIFGAIGNVIWKVMGAARDTIKEKLNNIKTAYQEHGGGIKGVAAAAIEGVKGFYTAGFTFIDKMTGGKLTEIKNKFAEKFEGVKNVVSTVMGAARDTIREKLDNMKAAYQAHGGGIKGVAAAAIEGVKGYYTAGFSFVDKLTGGKLSAIRDKFAQSIQAVKNIISNVFGWFKESGAKIITTFTDGIKGALSKPVEAVKGVLQKIRNMLPFSDAKEGPLSQLTLSGHRTLTTFAEGMQQAENAPAKAAEKSFGHIDMASSRKPVEKVNLREVTQSSTSTETTKSKDSGIRIGTLQLNVDFTKVKDIPKLIALIKEFEGLLNGNGTGDLNPEEA